MTKLLIIIGLFSTTLCIGQTIRRNSLLVAEYIKNEEDLGNYTNLVSYNFVDGIPISKDTILSAPTIHKGYTVGYSTGHNFIYQNRYVISGNGNVIDIQTKSLVIKESDKLIETRSDSLIFYRNNFVTGKGYLVCDLKNRTYGFVKKKKFMNVKGIHSPNHLWGLEIDQSQYPNKIVLFDKKNKQDVVVSNCGTGTLLSSFHVVTRPNIPVL